MTLPRAPKLQFKLMCFIEVNISYRVTCIKPKCISKGFYFFAKEITLYSFIEWYFDFQGIFSFPPRPNSKEYQNVSVIISYQ